MWTGGGEVTGDGLAARGNVAPVFRRGVAEPEGGKGVDWAEVASGL